ncbi:MAG: dipeptidase [Promethearchaeota archaeon]
MILQSIIRGLDLWFQFMSDPENNIIQIRSLEDFEKVLNSEKIGAILHFEGVGGIDSDYKILRIVRNLGLRSFSLTWSDSNKFENGSRFYGKQPKNGLPPLGKELVRKAQSMGITIDVSHLNDPFFWDLHEIAEKPYIASHSNVRSICGHVRNLTDDQIKAIQEKKGTIGINFSMNFLNPGKPGQANLKMSLEVIKKHVDHIVNLTDINTVAIGFDYDGTRVPRCVKNPTKFPSLWEFLLNNGYSRQDIKKISHENLLRVFKNTWT